MESMIILNRDLLTIHSNNNFNNKKLQMKMNY